MSGIAHINQKIREGGVILLPTETVYGLACNAADAQAVNKIYTIKGRAFQKPLAVCIKDLEMAQRFGVFTPKAIDLAKEHWPGSLTLIVEAKPEADIDAKCQSKLGNITTLAFRCPETNWLQDLNGPLALTSANRSGEKDCVSYEAACAEFNGEIDASLSSDNVLSGRPSTIISFVEDDIKILRQGTLKVTL